MKWDTRLIYNVTITYDDLGAIKEYEEAVEELSNRGCKDPKMYPVSPPRKTVSIKIGVFPVIGFEFLAKAAELAVVSVVGDKDCWDRYKPMVSSVVEIGYANIEMEG